NTWVLPARRRKAVPCRIRSRSRSKQVRQSSGASSRARSPAPEASVAPATSDRPSDSSRAVRPSGLTGPTTPVGPMWAWRTAEEAELRWRWPDVVDTHSSARDGSTAGGVGVDRSGVTDRAYGRRVTAPGAGALGSRPGDRGVLLAQLVLEHLAQRLVAGQGVDDDELLGELLLHQLGVGQRGDHLVEGEVVGRVCLGDPLDDRADALAALAVGKPDHRDVADLGVGVEHVLDLLGRDVLALADDHVLEPAGQHDVAVGADVAQVAGTEPAVVVERLGGG